MLGVAPQIQEMSCVLAPTRMVDCIRLPRSVPVTCQVGTSPFCAACSAITSRS